MSKILAIFAVVVGIFAHPLEFAFYQKGTPNDNTMLLIGGIQGDEPGGFLAASIVAMEYNITRGSLWVVPNLNFKSIIERSRGTNGDMNRKFANIDQNDPDFNAVTKIKSLIADKNVSMVLNLHDGSGFYREKFEDKDHNPNKWGNTAIIDQSILEGAKYPKLEQVATQITKHINAHLLKPNHRYHVKNTHTAEGDADMLRSLTYYAITQNKSAFANEASKSLNAAERTYYHLLAIEEYMRVAGIEFSRPFELNVATVKDVIEREIRIWLNDDYFLLRLKNAKSLISHVPLMLTQSGSLPNFKASNPLVALVNSKNDIEVRYGNRLLTRLKPSFFAYAPKFSHATIRTNGDAVKLKSGENVRVTGSFSVDKIDGLRTNVIGYNAKGDEAGKVITIKMLDKNYSIDKAGKIFRVEFYTTDNNEFAGMVLVEIR